MNEVEYAYIGRAPCGCARTLTIDDPNQLENTAKEISRWIRSGYVVERIPAAEAGTLFARCDHTSGVPLR